MANDETADLCPYEAVAKELLAICPGHELNKFLHMADPDVWEEFLAAFGHPTFSQEARRSPSGIAYAQEKYAEALRAACRNTRGITYVNHPPLEDGRFLVQ